MIAYLYNTLPSCLLSCSTVSRYVLLMYFYKSKHRLLLVTTPRFLWAASWNLGADKPLAQVQERKYYLLLEKAEPNVCKRAPEMCWKCSSCKWVLSPFDQTQKACSATVRCTSLAVALYRSITIARCWLLT